MAFFEGNKMTAGYGKGPDIISSCTINVNKGEIVANDNKKNLLKLIDKKISMERLEIIQNQFFSVS